MTEHIVREAEARVFGDGSRYSDDGDMTPVTRGELREYAEALTEGIVIEVFDRIADMCLGYGR